ncbi:MAG: zinc-ribbon domain-containing protein [Desulfovibrionaceae bacterium]|nr:zinc-ribbon domain-containing protein [Desulfovibrionaceae bacterium]
MRIQCPECGFVREVSETAIPESASFATCPKCEVRFRFRADPQEDPGRAAPRKAGRPAQKPEEEEIWASMEEMSAGDEEETPGDRERNGESARKASRAYQRSAGGAGVTLLSPGGSAPWECPGGFLRFSGFWRTLVLIAKDSLTFFAGLNPFSSILPSWLFLLLCNAPFIASMVMILNQVTIQAPGTGEMVSWAGHVGIPELVGLILAQISLYQFIGSLVVYCTVRLIAPKQASFRLTFKVSAYARMPMLFVVLPMIGPWMAWILSTVLLFLGMRRACRLSWPKTILSVTPFLVLTFIVVAQIMKTAIGALGDVPL